MPAGPRINVLEPAFDAAAQQASSSAMPVESCRAKTARCSAATRRGKTLTPPVVMVKS